MQELSDLFTLEFVEAKERTDIGKLTRDKSAYGVNVDSKAYIEEKGSSPLIHYIIENFILKYLRNVRERHPELKYNQDDKEKVYYLESDDAKVLELKWKGYRVTARFNKDSFPEYILRSEQIFNQRVRLDIKKSLKPAKADKNPSSQ